MLRLQRECHAEAPAQRFAAESRHAVDQIDREVGETRTPQPAHGSDRVGGRVAAVHHPQARVVKRLHAHRHAVDLRIAQPGHVLPGQVVGIALHGDLLRTAEAEEAARMRHELLQLPGRAERRRAAPEVERAHRRAAQRVGACVELAVHGVKQRPHGTQVGAARKIAVGADAPTERNMEIDARHGAKVTNYAAFAPFGTTKRPFSGVPHPKRTPHRLSARRRSVRTHPKRHRTADHPPHRAPEGSAPRKAPRPGKRRTAASPQKTQPQAPPETERN